MGKRVIKYGLRLGEDRLPYLVREMSHNYSGQDAGGPSQIADILREIEGGPSLIQEKFWMFCLDNCLRIIGYFEMLAGGKHCCLVDSSLLFTSALAAGADSIVLAHNHPSGDLSPSEKDVALTKRVAKGAELLGMHLEDHVVVCGGSYASIRSIYPEIFLKEGEES